MQCYISSVTVPALVDWAGDSVPLLVSEAEPAVPATIQISLISSINCQQLQVTNKIIWLAHNSLGT